MSHSQLSSDLLEEQTHQFQTATCHTIWQQLEPDLSIKSSTFPDTNYYVANWHGLSLMAWIIWCTRLNYGVCGPLAETKESFLSYHGLWKYGQVEAEFHLQPNCQLAYNCSFLAMPMLLNLGIFKRIFQYWSQAEISMYNDG
jgi:hypothetical protein